MSTPTDRYAALCAPFPESETFVLRKGGAALTYITGEAVTTRLNTVLGVDGWTFEIVEHGQDEQHAWALGRCTVYFPDRAVTRAQFGECGRGRGMSLGDARKGAATDALKRCAMTFGVGLYLSHKEEHAEAEQRNAAPPGAGAAGRQLPPPGDDRLTCETCGAELGEIRFRDGTNWLPAQLASLGQRKHGKTLCMDHYRQANEARRRFETPDPGRAF